MPPCMQAEVALLTRERATLASQRQSLQAELAQVLAAAQLAGQAAITPRTFDAERRRAQALASEISTLK